MCLECRELNTQRQRCSWLSVGQISEAELGETITTWCFLQMPLQRWIRWPTRFCFLILFKVGTLNWNRSNRTLSTQAGEHMMSFKIMLRKRQQRIEEALYHVRLSFQAKLNIKILEHKHKNSLSVKLISVLLLNAKAYMMSWPFLHIVSKVVQ